MAIGDLVLTLSGAVRPVKWIGHRSYAGRFLAAIPQVQPVRFRAGSIYQGVPRWDLLASPEHAMLLDGLLIPARYLVNGEGIVRERGLRQVDYFHVELDSHDVILAEGAPSETFLDDDSRRMFHNGGDFVSRGGDAPPPALCAPRVTDGYALEMIRQQLAAREVAVAA